MNAVEYFTNIVFRTKKNLKLRLRVRNPLEPCSNGSSMLQPIESPSPSIAPRLAASMIPGPPPVMTQIPASARSRAVSTALA